MTPEELLKRADEALAEKGWCTGWLTHPEEGSHCSLGAIGYARWGDEWDTENLNMRLDGKGNWSSYQKLMYDPLAAAACARLADAIRTSRGACGRPGIVPIEQDPYLAGTANDINEIMCFNDCQRWPKGGKARIRKFFAKAAKVTKKVIDHQPRVEYEPAVGKEPALEKVADL